jgi:hypothetical protein
VIAKGIATVAFSGIVLVESIIFAGHDIDNRRGRQPGADKAKRSRE